jgi:hypothetical protein
VYANCILRQLSPFYFYAIRAIAGHADLSTSLGSPYFEKTSDLAWV